MLKVFRVLAVFMFGAFMVLAAAQAQNAAQPQNATNIVNDVVSTLRVWGGLIGMAGFAAGAWYYMRYMSKMKVAQAQTDAVAIFRNELDARKMEVERLRQDTIAKDQELITLRSRTDITEVIKLQQDMLKECRTHDSTVANTLNAAIERGGEQYKAVMETLKKTLDYLSEQARLGNASAKTNTEQLVAIGGSLNRIADKLIMVEKKVEGVQDTADSVQEIMTDASAPDTPKRRKNDQRDSRH